MKIVAIDPLVCSMPVRHRVAAAAVVPRNLDMLLVRVTTDEGLVGWGESFSLMNAWPAARTALQTVVGPRCIGRDPRAITALTRDVLHQVHQLGRSGSVMHAWSAVETALWDILGKSLSVPLHVLLGGAQATQLKAYASLPRYGAVAPVVHDCELALQQGFKAIKLHEITMQEIAAAARALDGHGGIELMVDANCAWTLEQAMEMARQLRDIPLAWLEEPLTPADDYAQLAHLRADCAIPIACGETVGAISDFHTMLRLDAVDFVQPSVAKLGGIGAARRVFELAADSAVEVAPHTPLFGPALLATLHLCAALAPQTGVESYFLDVSGNPFGDAVRVRDGRIEVPSAPGLGFDPDPDLLRRCLLD